ncbi:MAG: hypothetical protein V4596_03660 [Bdellovibrionota bacterium]
MHKFLKLITVLLYFASFGISASENSLFIDSKIKNGESVEFLKFSGPGQWDNYLTMNLPFEPTTGLLQELQNKENLILKNRGEAHITVITPVEYWNILKPLNITMYEINQIAESMKIQSSQFDILCLGIGKSTADKELKTFYIVVHSENLLNIRREIQSLVVAKGGNLNDFDPDHFYPHITLGYTQRDLHESDGVFKDKNTCIYQLTTFDNRFQAHPNFQL